MKTTKKNIVTKSLAVGLAAVLLTGLGSYSYLNSKTEDVTNTFSANKVLVDIEEESGSEYNIVPGTSETKNPKVIVDSSVDAYVYLIVTDNTQGLVNYTIDESWTALEDFDNVYYQEVKASSDSQTFNVLVNDTVSYSSQLTNSDMLDENGNLKDGIELSFNALAMQVNDNWSAKGSYFYLTYGYYFDGYINNNISTLAQLNNAITNEDYYITITSTITQGTLEVNTIGNGIINMNSSFLAQKLKVTGGTLTLIGDTTSFDDVDIANVYNTKSKQSSVEVSNEGTILNIESGKYKLGSGNASLIEATSGSIININGGCFRVKKASTVRNVFEADDSTIYVNDYDEINIDDTDTKCYLYKATNGGTIYVAASIFTDSVNPDSQVSDSTVTINGTEYYVITEA